MIPTYLPAIHTVPFSIINITPPTHPPIHPSIHPSSIHPSAHPLHFQAPPPAQTTPHWPFQYFSLFSLHVAHVFSPILFYFISHPFLLLRPLHSKAKLANGTIMCIMKYTRRYGIYFCTIEYLSCIVPVL